MHEPRNHLLPFVVRLGGAIFGTRARCCLIQPFHNKKEIMSKELTVIQRAAVALSAAEHEKNLIALSTKYADLVEIKNPAAREQVHSAYMELKNTRVAIQKAAKDAREDANQFSKAVIAEAERLTSITTGEETRLQALRDDWDAERERERKEKAEAEANRIKAIRDCIEEFRQAPGACPATSSQMLDEHADDLARAPITLEAYMEFTGEAEAARDVAVNALRNMAEKARQREAEEARIKAELLELARLRAEQEERDRAAAAERAEHERKAREALEAEEARLRAERAAEEAKLRAEREAEEAKLRAEREAHEAEMRAQREELARQQAELEAARRRQAEEAEAKRRAEQEERAKALRELAEAQEKAEREARERASAENRAARLAPEATGGNWTLGKTGGCVVTDVPIPGGAHSSHDEIEYYGGHLICESVYRPADARLIAAAPALLKALQQIATHDCGCAGIHQCMTGRAAEIELEERMQIAIDAIAAATTEAIPA